MRYLIHDTAADEYAVYDTLTDGPEDLAHMYPEAPRVVLDAVESLCAALDAGDGWDDAASLLSVTVTRQGASPDEEDQTEEALRAAQETLDVAQGAAAEAVRARDEAIRSALATGLGPSRIAAILGVERGAIYKIKRRA